MPDISQRRPIVAIIGGGFSGVAVAFHLTRAAVGAMEIVVVEPASTLGRGLAYATPCDSHRLNVPAGRLGIDPDHESGFADWLQARGDPWLGSSFAPRSLFGEFIGSELARGAAMASGIGVVTRHLRARTVSLARQGGRFDLGLSDGSRLQADAVVLATGHLPPALPGGRGPIDWSAPGMVSDPWKGDGAPVSASTQDIALLGSGLTAIDVVMQHDDAGHRGRFHLLSRRGMLPRPHRFNETRPSPIDTPADLHATVGLRHLVSSLRQWILHAEAEGSDWRDALAALRPATPRLWRSLTQRDRSRFLRHVQPFWDTHRHRLSADIHQRLKAMRDDGRLTLVAGRLEAIDRLADGRLRITWRPRGGGPTERLVVGTVMNCTGPSTDLARASDPLLASMRDAGLLSVDPLGLGLKVDPWLQVLDARSQRVDGLYHVGPMLKAQHWEAVAVPELRLHARDVARRIATSLA